jgi:hypothetical protein
MTLQQAANLFDVSPKTVQRWHLHGVIHRVGRSHKLVFDEDEIRALIPEAVRNLTLVRPSVVSMRMGIRSSVLGRWMRGGVFTECCLPHYLPGQKREYRITIEEVKAALKAGPEPARSDIRFTRAVGLERLGVSEALYCTHLNQGVVDDELFTIRSKKVPHAARKYAVYLFHNGLLTI